jgi:hypothetical protein
MLQFMINLVKIPRGFIMNNRSYLFQDFYQVGVENPQLVAYQILSDNQAYSGTDNGIILMDTSMTIDGESFDSIQAFINQLYS